MKLVVTLFKSASEEAKDVYVETLKSANIVSQMIPVIEFKFCNMDILKENLAHPERYSGLILSSPRCVQALKHSLSNDKLHPAWKDKHCFVVGPATEKLARSLFDLKPVGSEAGKGANLVPIIIQSLGSETEHPLLMPVSNLALDNIGSALRKEKMSIDTPTVYETLPSSQLQEDIKLSIDPSVQNVLVFFSPSGAKSTIPLLEKRILESSKVISVGSTTSEALRSLGVTVSGECKQPTPESLLDTVTPLIQASS